MTVKTNHSKYLSVAKRKILMVCILFLILLNTIPNSYAQSNELSLGVGLGIPYGILGISLDYNIIDNLYLSGAIGTTIFAGTGYSVGAKYHIFNSESSWRPRVSAFYGTNAIIQTLDNDLNLESYQGISLGVGLLKTLGTENKHGIDFDVLYIVSKGDFDKQKEYLENNGYIMDKDYEGNIKFSIGYRYFF